MNPLHELQTRSVDTALGAVLERLAGQLPSVPRSSSDALPGLSGLAAESTAAIERVRDEADDA